MTPADRWCVGAPGRRPHVPPAPTLTPIGDGRGGKLCTACRDLIARAEQEANR